ncbi:hypothetical protein DCMF_01315 [Candidatus Formimonas warabiya]|uniref:Probable multidrug resistance protein NorM n=2 Tax=Formimonas warabiya TaxID=1761012 RepID=A0A3G1KMF8_FORW1|nr:hypothetical protein DCMF_01315 [Candidatus Formimonas warabiya]
MKDNYYLISKSFQRYLVPSILAILGGNISFMADHIIAGKVLGSNALAAMSMVNPLFFLFTTLGTLICVGSSTMASICLGKEDRHTANKLFTLTALLVLILGGLISITGYLFLNPLVNLISDGKELHAMVYEYCRGLIPGSICIMAVYLPLNFFRIEGRGHLGMMMFLIMAVLDIGLDLYFTLVLGMGMFGLAIATVFSSLIAVIVMFPFLFTKGGYRFVSIGKSIRLVNGILIVGSPPALNNFYSVIRTFILNMLILAFGGPVAVAGFAFVNSVNTLAQAIVSGIAQTVSPLVGVFYGEHDVISIRKVFTLAIKFGLASMVVFSILISVFARQICLLFGLTSTGQQQIAIPALVICSLSLTGVMVNQILGYYYMTIGRTKIANLLTLCRGLLFIVLAALMLSQVWGLYGIWISFSVSELLTLAIVMITARQTLRRERELSGVLLLNHRDVDEGRFISFSVDTNVEAVMESSDKISDFCENCRLNPKQSMVISLAIEEILLLMLKQVFEGKDHDSIDVKIFVRDDRVIMRFRCGGRKFNPLEYYKTAMEKSHGPEDLDTDESMGLKLISKMAKKVDYSTNLGLNNIIIRL